MTKYAAVRIKISKDLKNVLEELAAAQHKSIDDLIVEMLEDALRQEGGSFPEPPQSHLDSDNNET